MSVKMPEIRTCKLGGHVGLDGLADQIINKAIAQGFQFNILCVGETGIGKSTLVSTLFSRNFELVQSSQNSPHVKLKSQTYDIAEANVRLRLTITESIGFGDQLNKEESFKPLVHYLDEQFERYLQEEMKIKRSQPVDTRVHVCLYFIAPTGHSLKALDLATLKKLCKKVNIIPIIAKSDTITKGELHKFKAKINQELAANEVDIYQFPTDDEETASQNTQMNQMMPFAVIGSTEEVKVGSKMVRARQYPWGTVQVEDENHCEFVHLREMLLRINTQDLIETTHLSHYEQYRRERLAEMGFNDELSSVQEAYKQKRADLVKEMNKKEQEMKESFVIRVKEKEAELKQSETQLHMKFDSMKARHANEKKSLEEMEMKLREEKQLFQQQKEQFEREQSSTMRGKKK